MVSCGSADGVGGFDRFVYRALDGCWYWIGDTDAYGYGRYTFSAGRSQSRIARKPAHRLVYELEVGKIPDGYEIDHRCRTRLCVRPDHLEAITGAENRKRQGAARMQCVRGHELVLRDKRGWRYCKECHRLGEAARAARKSEK